MEDQQSTPATNQLDNFFNIPLDAATRSQIKQAAQWARICSLCAFIGYAISLTVLFIGSRISTAAGFDSEEGQRIVGMVRATTIVFALITTAIGVIINLFLYRFAMAASRGMDAMDNHTTNDGFNSLRKYFKINGILLIIGLCIAGLGILGLLAGLGAAGR